MSTQAVHKAAVFLDSQICHLPHSQYLPSGPKEPKTGEQDMLEQSQRAALILRLSLSLSSTDTPTICWMSLALNINHTVGPILWDVCISKPTTS